MKTKEFNSEIIYEKKQKNKLNIFLQILKNPFKAIAYFGGIIILILFFLVAISRVFK